MKTAINLFLQSRSGAWAKIIGLMLLLTLNPPAFLLAQNPARGIKFEHFTSEHGLSSSLILCMLQDHQGFMWFGTAYGLSKYDGSKDAPMIEKS